jgi:hypothetical protein
MPTAQERFSATNWEEVEKKLKITEEAIAEGMKPDYSHFQQPTHKQYMYEQWLNWLQLSVQNPNNLPIHPKSREK